MPMAVTAVSQLSSSKASSSHFRGCVRCAVYRLMFFRERSTRSWERMALANRLSLKSFRGCTLQTKERFGWEARLFILPSLVRRSTLGLPRSIKSSACARRGRRALHPGTGVLPECSAFSALFGNLPRDALENLPDLHVVSEGLSNREVKKSRLLSQAKARTTVYRFLARSPSK